MKDNYIKDLVSVIVPVYNDEKYLEECVNSILNQTYQRIEVILMDDGSTDRTPDICRALALRDDRVRIFRKDNGGVGDTRNAALKEVRGEFLLFVDHDDWLDPTQIEFLYRKLKETDSDIAISNFSEFIEQTKVFNITVSKNDYYDRIMTPAEWFAQQYHSKFNISQCFTVPWGKLYKSALFENIVYPTAEKVEDDLTTWKVYLNAERLVYSNIAMYIHRKLPTSVTKTVSPTDVYPLKSIEERITMLSLLGMDISNELNAYRWRLTVHKNALLKEGKMDAYRNVVHKLQLIENKG